MQQLTRLFPKSDDSTSTEDWYPVRHEVLLDVAHQALPGLSFLLPAAAPLKQLQVQLGNEVLPIKTTIVRVADQDFHAIEFPISPDRLRGNLKFVVTHLLGATAAPSASAAVPIVVPTLQILVEPLSRLVPVTDNESLHHFLTSQVAGFQIQQREIRTPLIAGQTFEVSTSEWGKLAESEVPDSWSRWILNGPWPLQVQVTREEVAAMAPEIFVDSIHVRTWWADQQRREQMTATIVSQEPALVVKISPELEIRQVLVDGQAVKFEIDGQLGLVQFPLTESEIDSELSSSVAAVDSAKREIEIWYARNQPTGAWTRLTLQLPQLPNQDWCRNFTWEVAASDWWQVVWASQELTPLTNILRRQRGAEESSEADAAEHPTHHYSSHYEPDQYGLILIHRRWLRLGVIMLVCGGVLLGWRFSWYRNSAFWLAAASAIVGVAWQWPDLGWEVAPWVTLAFLAAMLVLWIEFATRRIESPTAAFEGPSEATRSYWNDGAPEQERSGPSMSQRSSAVAGDPS
jgi:hypothetical protein